jgi:response regulator RpfG family c-di-GMP phosphodiesterase
MKPRILCVDDEPLVLTAQSRHLGKHFEVEGEGDPRAALVRVQNAAEPYQVVVSDYNMPGMNGVELLAHVRRASPDTARVMLTGRADLGVAIQAVNEGNVFRFLTKPCPPETLIEVINAGVRQYRLETAERELLQKTLRGSVKVLSDVLSLTSPLAFGRSSRVYRLVQRIVPALCWTDDVWEVMVAAMLCQIGCVAVPPDIVERASRGQELTAEERAAYDSHPALGRDLLSTIPRLEAVGEIVGYQNKDYDGGGFPPDDRRGSDIPLGARLLHAALAYDALTAGGRNRAEALGELSANAGRYDPAVLAAMGAAIRGEDAYVEREVGVWDLRPEMVLAGDLESPAGLLLMVKGHELSPTLQAKLKRLVAGGHLADNFRVLVPVDPEPS